MMGWIAELNVKWLADEELRRHGILPLNWSPNTSFDSPGFKIVPFLMWLSITHLKMKFR